MDLSTVLTVAQLIPTAMTLMHIAEKVFVEKGAGAEKKEFVMTGINNIAESMALISTGGQKKTWMAIDMILDAFSPLIDRLASLMFPNKD